MFDSHCHLDFEEFDAGFQGELRAGQADGLTGLLIPGVHDGLWAAQDERATSSLVHLATGLHPWWVQEDEDLGLLGPRLAERARICGAVAIGECGLDVKHLGASLPAQVRCFELQLELSRELSLPVIIHQVGARAQLLQALARVGLPRAGGVVHGFSGDAAWAQALASRGLSLSVGVAVLRGERARLREAVRRIPDGSLLVETDAPNANWPSGVTKRAHFAGNLALVIAELARLREATPAALGRLTEVNAARLFSISLDLGAAGCTPGAHGPAAHS